MSTCVYNRMYCVLPVARVVQLYYSNTTAVESYPIFYVTIHIRNMRAIPIAARIAALYKADEETTALPFSS